MTRFIPRLLVIALMAIGLLVPASMAQAAAHPDLVVFMDDVQDPTSGPVDYTIRVRNVGQARADGVELVIELDDDVTFDSFGGSGASCVFDNAENNVVCKRARLGRGKQFIITVDSDSDILSGTITSFSRVRTLRTCEVRVGNNDSIESTTVVNDQVE